MKQNVSKLADVKRQALIILQKREYAELGKTGRNSLRNGTPREQGRYKALKRAHDADIDFRKLHKDASAFVDFSTDKMTSGNKSWISKVAVNLFVESSKNTRAIRPNKKNRKEYAKLTGQSTKSKVFFVPLRDGEKVKIKTTTKRKKGKIKKNGKRGKGRKIKEKKIVFEKKELGGDGTEIKTPFYVDPQAFAQNSSAEMDRVLDEVDSYLRKSKAELVAYYIGTGKYIFGGVETPAAYGKRTDGGMPPRNLLTDEIKDWEKRYGTSVRINAKQAPVSEFFTAVYAVEFFA